MKRLPSEVSVCSLHAGLHVFTKRCSINRDLTKASLDNSVCHCHDSHLSANDLSA